MRPSKFSFRLLTVGFLAFISFFILIHAKPASAIFTGGFLQNDALVKSSWVPFPLYLGQMQEESVGNNLYVGLYGAGGSCVYDYFYITEYQTEDDMRHDVNRVASAPFKHSFWVLQNGIASRHDGGAIEIFSAQNFALKVDTTDDFKRFHAGHWYAINGSDCGDQSRSLTLYGHGQQIFWSASDNKYQSLNILDHPYDEDDAHPRQQHRHRLRPQIHMCISTKSINRVMERQPGFTSTGHYYRSGVRMRSLFIHL